MRNTDNIGMTDSLATHTVAHSSSLIGDPTFFWRLMAVTILLALGISFILIVIKLLLEHRIKRQVIERNLSPDTARIILGAGSNALKEAMLKWFLIFAGIAGGLFIVALTTPGEIYSLAIIAACIALSFGAYYLITGKNKTGNE